MIPASSVRETNQLLTALPQEELHLLQPDLEWVELVSGELLYEAGTLLTHVYFPVTAVVSLVSIMKDGASAEVAVVGREGMVGVYGFMGGGCAHNSAVVQSAGYGWRMTAAAIAGHAKRSAVVMRQLLRYTQALFTFMAQTSACNRHHALDQQLARWLLVNLDRSGGNELLVTQQQIASMLGVRREGVTSGALKLRKAGLIRYGRGRIAVVDRAGLEECSCECYSVVRGAFDRLACSPVPKQPGSSEERNFSLYHGVPVRRYA